MMRLKNFKRTEFIIVVFVLCTVNVGCSHIDRQEQEQNITKTEQEETVVSLPIPSTEDIEISEKNDTGTQKQIEIEKIKQYAEENAEKDRNAILEALGNVEADNRCDKAVLYIKDSYPDYFSNDALIKESIEYGHYLVSVYQDSEGIDNGRGRYFEMGKIVSEVAQDIYLGKRTLIDDTVIEKMRELESLLQQMYDQYYGGYKGEVSQPDEKILISNHPILNKTPFFAASLGDVLTSSYEEYSSAETEDGYWDFFEEAGIIYATGGPEKETDFSSKRIRGVVLTTPQYEFCCGLKVGINVQDLMEMDLIFNESSLENIPNYSFLTFLKEKFDCDEVYIATEALSYDATYSNLIYRLLAFVKNDKVIAVSVDDTLSTLQE